MLAVALVLIGQGNTMFYLGIGSWIAMHVPYERRGRVIGLIEVSWAFGLLIGVSTMGLVTAATNWRVGYLSGAAAMIVMAIVVVGRIDAPTDEHRTAAAVKATGRLISRGWLVLLSGFAITAASHTLIVTFGSWLEDEFGLTPAGLSVVTFLLGAGELVATLSVARFTDVWGKRRSVAVGAALMIPASAGLGAVAPQPGPRGRCCWRSACSASSSRSSAPSRSAPAWCRDHRHGPRPAGRRRHGRAGGDVGAGDAALHQLRHRLAGSDGDGPGSRSQPCTIVLSGSPTPASPHGHSTNRDPLLNRP